ncbi:PHP domain-containing protein [Flavobacteriales bacterium]|nr:PHP domain-containing protein [Flavobacteriales bacterium]
MYLNNHSWFSLRYGIMRPEELLAEAQAAGVSCMALTDVHCTAGGPDFARLAPQYGIRPVLGVDFRNGAVQHYIGLARDHDGYERLCGFLSELLHTGRAGKPAPLPDRAPVIEGVVWVYPWARRADVAWMRPGADGLRTSEFVGVRPSELGTLRIALQRDPSGTPHQRMVALQTASFRNKRDHNAHRLLRSIDRNCLLAKLPESQVAPITDRLLRTGELEHAYAEFPWLTERADALLEACHIDFAGDLGDQEDGATHRNIRTFTGSIVEDERLLRDLCAEGIAYRYPEANETILDRMEHEIEVLREKEFLAYFLVNWDITTYARSKGYFHVGRGSGANSLVAYLLRITDVDPIELDLYFERFINLYRSNPPDFDLDFSWTDRDDVTRYIFERYEHVALLGAYNTFQYRAVVRELSKVFGLPKHEVDMLANGRFDPAKLGEVERAVIRYSSVLRDFPNQISIHACGIVIADRPIHRTCATFLPPKGFPTTQYDMVVAEDLDLHKFDILSQRGLAKIKDALDLIAHTDPNAQIDIHDMKRFKTDKRVQHLLREAEAIGCFYVESPAMRMLMRKLRVDDYLGLVAASSVIRPGVARSGMMRAYIERHRFPERRNDAHPVLLEIMPETYGVMVYQEDVIKVAHQFAGLDLGEADVLRRGMSGKFRSREEFQKARQAFFDKARSKGHPNDMVAEVWRQVESFAGYAFAKGHSASFAVESYQSLFIKAYWPLEYMTACINNFGGFYRTEFYVHEARLLGGSIAAPCVNTGGYAAGYNPETRTITLGFNLVKGVEGAAAAAIERERNANGPYRNLEGFVRRTGTTLEQLLTIIRIGGLRWTGRSKQQLQWEAHFLLGHLPKRTSTADLFMDNGSTESQASLHHLPQLSGGSEEDAYDEIELLGFPLSSPFGLLTSNAKNQAHAGIPARALPEFIGSRVTISGYLVTVKETSTVKGDRMLFGCFVDREGQWLDTVHFPKAASAFPFRGRGVYLLNGTAKEEFGCIHVEVSFMEKLDLMPDPRYDESTPSKQRPSGSRHRKVPQARRLPNAS